MDANTKGDLKMGTYKDSNIEPELGDIVLLNGSEVEVANIRLDTSTMITNCAWEGKLCLDSPSEFEFVRRKVI